MKVKSISWAIASLVLVQFSAHQAFSQTDLQTQIDQIVQPLVEQKKVVGIVVGVISPGTTLISGYGQVAQGSNRVPDGKTIFEIGSITKVFNSLALSRLQREGLLDFGAEVQSLLPSGVVVPEKDGKKITLEHLATHFSGLAQTPINLTPKEWSNPYAQYGERELFQYLSAATLSKAPGERFEYSNLGAGLLGHILSRTHGTSFDLMIQDLISVPLGLVDTCVQLTGEQSRRFAQGHSAKLEGFPYWDFDVLAGAGALRSTGEDMLKFLSFQLAYEASPDLTLPIQETHRPRFEIKDKEGNPTGAWIGLGWFQGVPGIPFARDLTWHNGMTGGFTSFVGFSKKTGTGVVVLSNQSPYSRYLEGQRPTDEEMVRINALGLRILKTAGGI